MAKNTTYFYKRKQLRNIQYTAVSIKFRLFINLYLLPFLSSVIALSAFCFISCMTWERVLWPEAYI